MKFVTVKTETSLADLTRDVFEIKGAKAAASKSAQAALREANPHVAHLTKVPKGTLVMVPDVPGVKTTPAQSLGQVSMEMVKRLESALAAAGTVIEKSAAVQLEDADATASLVKNRELVALAKQTPDLKERLSEIGDRAKVQAKQAADDKKAQTQALGQLEKDLASLSAK
jgi:phage tail protein X